jgi:transcriptional regulator with XRE-family HTH domain
LTGRELKRIRLQLGLTQKELGMRLGVSRNAVARWEVGLRGISKLAEVALRCVSSEVRKSGRKAGR